MGIIDEFDKDFERNEGGGFFKYPEALSDAREWILSHIEKERKEAQIEVLKGLPESQVGFPCGEIVVRWKHIQAEINRLKGDKP